MNIFSNVDRDLWRKVHSSIIHSGRKLEWPKHLNSRKMVKLIVMYPEWCMYLIK